MLQLPWRIESALLPEGREEATELGEDRNNEKPIEGGIETIRFNSVPYLTRFIRGLYPKKQSFYSGDFKDLLITVQNNWSTKGDDYKEYRIDHFTLADEKVNANRFCVVVGRDAFTSFWMERPNGEMSIYPKKELVALLFLNPEPDYLKDSPTYLFLNRVFWFTNELINKSAIAPRLVAVLQEEYAIQWLPALMNAAVEKIFNQLLELTPDSMVVYSKVGLQDWHFKEGKHFLELKRKEALLLMIAALISDYVGYFEAMSEKYYVAHENKHEIKLAKLFFADRRLPVLNSKTVERAEAIHHWLQVQNLALRDFMLYLKFHELEGMDMGVEVIALKRDGQPYEGPISTELKFLCEYLPKLEEVIYHSKGIVVRMKWNEFQEVLEKSQPIMEAIGVRFVMPEGLYKIHKPQISMHLKQHTGVTSLSLKSLLEFEWRVAIGDQLMDPAAFSQMVEETRGLVRINNTYMQVIYGDIRRFLEQLKSPAKPSGIQLFHSALSSEYNGVRVDIDEGLKQQIKELNDIKEVELPLSLQASLRPYQQRGFSWMYKNAQLGFGCLLADDMGLGKTIQIVTLLLKLKEEGNLKKHPALVIAPTSLLSNWEAEMKKFGPTLDGFIYHGSNRKEDFKGKDVILTTYGVIRSDLELFSKQKWKALVLDEAQNIKNSGTDQTKAIKKLHAEIRIALTGTPVENRLKEYWSIFDFTNHGYLGTENNFNEKFAKPIEMDQNKQVIARFLAITSPFILRRLKSDKSIIADLPDKFENDQFCSLSTWQAAVYQSTTQELMTRVIHSEGINRRGIVFKLLIALKQICNHPLQYLRGTDEPLAEDSGKVLLLFQLLESIYENNEKVLIFSQYKETGDMLNKLIAKKFNKQILQLHGGTSRPERTRMVEEFQQDPSIQTFILSLKAGGTGLNLTAANHVIHFDLWWNPAVENQASDRAYRIGQEKNVMVHRLITAGTLEEKIDNLLKQKKNLSDLTVASGERWIGELSNDELSELVGLN